MNLIEVKNVKKHYLNKTFNLTIKQNDKLLIVGKNGSGKSTLIKLLTSYIKQSRGKIFKNINKISYLEEAISLPNNIVVSEYLELMETIKHGRYLENLFNLFNVPLNKKIKELSKGNKQKLAILTTFIGNSDLVILDEPLNGLDSEIIIKFLEFINHYHKPIIIITHYPNYFNNMNFEVLEL